MKTIGRTGCLPGCLAILALAITIFAAFITRIRLYDSIGTYKGFGNIGTAPIYLLISSVGLGLLAWFVWRQKSK